ncbi:MAG TPA: hypothetical protein VND70_07040 [Acidimicrobiales bacterium]|nr:hypothetical protein [Acidimicrobiales bacterium]
MNVDLRALAGPRDRLMVDGAVDPVTSEGIRGTMETVCFEMAMCVSRTATTPILNQSNERNATILDGKDRLAALRVEGAARDYGVVLTGSLEELTLVVDEAATRERRSAMRAGRLAAA